MSKRRFLQDMATRSIVLMLAVVACSSLSQAQEKPAAPKWSKDPVSLCEFVAPASLTAGPTYWVGVCKAGKASGSGMLRRRDGNRPGPAFYGEMQNGIPVIGVIDDEGYRVGRFHNGDIGGEAELEPQTKLDAFEAAVKAARDVSAYYAKQGNESSARYYETIIRQLDLQIE